MISGLQENGVPNLMLFIIYLFQFCNDLLNHVSPIFWEGLIVIPIFLVLILFIITKNFKFMFLCFIILLISEFYFSGFFFQDNYKRATSFMFLVPFIIFILSSAYVSWLNLKKID